MRLPDRTTASLWDIVAPEKAMIENPRTGILLRILSRILFAGMSICIKSVAAEIAVGQIVFFRSAFALIPLVIFLWMRAEFPCGLATRRPLGHRLRSSLGAAAMFASFASIARLPLAEATLLTYLSPTFTRTAGFLLLSEKATIWPAAGVVLGLAGSTLNPGIPQANGSRTSAYPFH